MWCGDGKERTMSDIISREDALRELNGVCANWEDDAKVAEIISALPTAEINCVHCPNYYETEDDDGVKGHCRADRPMDT